MFPELTETFVLREIQECLKEGVPITVLAIEAGAGTEFLRGALACHSQFALHYLGGSRQPASRSRPQGPLPRGAGMTTLAGALLSDVTSLRAHPRRCARALRLGALACAARRFVPAGASHLHAHFANDAAALARYLSLLSGLPYRVTGHAYDLYQDPFLLGPNLRGAERVYTVSRSNLEHLAARATRESWSMERFSVLHCGIDLEAFPYRDPAPPSTPARLLCVARLVPKKGHLLLLEAVARLSREGLPLELDLVGDGPLAAAVREGALCVGGPVAVRLHGAVPHPRIRELLDRADLAVLASRIADDGDRDGIPVFLMEAMGTGVPVVATDVTGISELVGDGAGRLVPPDRSDLLAEAIRASLEEDTGRRTAQARRARAQVESEFDLKRQVAALLEV